MFPEDNLDMASLLRKVQLFKGRSTDHSVASWPQHKEQSKAQLVYYTGTDREYKPAKQGRMQSYLTHAKGSEDLSNFSCSAQYSW